jgi:hypothetical protein
VPPTATQWWLLRPREIFAHPRLGATLSHSVDHLAERALIDRAARTGYDLRALEQGLWAATPTGELALGLGAFDGASAHHKNQSMPKIRWAVRRCIGWATSGKPR